MLIAFGWIDSIISELLGINVDFCELVPNNDNKWISGSKFSGLRGEIN